MMINLVALISGLLFSFGLVISGMTNPDKVIGFLDLFGNFDYSLAFVMIGAIATHSLIFKLIKGKKPLFAEKQHLPENSSVDKKLISGAVLFGIGWGLAGFCPGPALVNLVTLDQKAVVFVLSMLGGMFLFKMIEKALK